MKDNYGREINYMRISLTDRCNLRCVYCLPENTALKANQKMLSKEDILKITEGAKELGITKIRLTGGEPLLRDDITDIIKGIYSQGIKDIHLTTNGTLLGEKAQALKEAGLTGINVSLDTLDDDLYTKMTRGGELIHVLLGIQRARFCGLKVKLNAVIIKGLNESSVRNLAGLTTEEDMDVRFIELMPMGEGKNFTGISNDEIYNILEKRYGFDNSYFEEDGVAKYYKLKKGVGRIGFISPINNCFCETCNKIRVTSDGNIKRCLNINGHVNIKDCIDKGADKESIKKILENEILNKPEKHLFGEENADEEMKNMNQIGG